MQSSFVTGLSLLRIRIQPEGGGRFPQGRVLDSPLPLSDPPPCAPPSTQTLLNSLLMQGLSSSKVLWFRVLSPFACAQVTPNPSVIY